MKAIGESVERYCSAQYVKDTLPFLSYEELEGEAVNPSDFALFSDRQYMHLECPFSRMTPTARLRWAQGFSLVSENEVFLPAASVFVPYQSDSEKEAKFDYPVSTGLACATTLAGAIYKGIIEVVERDAFMITWQNRIPPPSIDIWSLDDPCVQRLLSVFKGLPVRIHAVFLTLDIPIPVILILVCGESGCPPFTVAGFGADLNPIRALTLALEEACLSVLVTGRYAQSNPDNFWPASDYHNVVNLNLHALAHAIAPNLRNSVEFLTSSREVISLKKLPDVCSESMMQNVLTMVAMIKKKHLDVIFVDLTTQDIDESGFKVARTIIPGLQPLDINHNWQHLGGERIYQVPFQMGLLSEPLSEDSLNAHPHPFP